MVRFESFKHRGDGVHRGSGLIPQSWTASPPVA
jgi:hypothetical protein